MMVAECDRQARLVGWDVYGATGDSGLGPVDVRAGRQPAPRLERED